jgi:hypothetical protein
MPSHPPHDAPGAAPPALGPVQDILAALRGAIGGETVTVARLHGAMDAPAQPVLLLLPALILVSPLSGIPGFATVGGLTIALIALQMLVNRPAIWLPGLVLRRSLTSARILRALDRLDRPARFIDRHTVARAGWFVSFPGRQLALGTCALCGLAMPFLELVPFSATTLATVVTILAAALLVRDGVIVALGLAVFGGAIALLAGLALP